MPTGRRFCGMFCVGHSIRPRTPLVLIAVTTTEPQSQCEAECRVGSSSTSKNDDDDDDDDDCGDEEVTGDSGTQKLTMGDKDALSRTRSVPLTMPDSLKGALFYTRPSTRSVSFTDDSAVSLSAGVDLGWRRRYQNLVALPSSSHRSGHRGILSLSLPFPPILFVLSLILTSIH
jgi:hypothetical protein